MQFKKFSEEVSSKYNALRLLNAFTTEVSGDDLWSIYLNSFPEGTNPIHKERTYHDCSTCRDVIRNIGHIVYIVDGEAQTLWSGLDIEEPYVTVAKAMDEALLNSPIQSLYMTNQERYGKNVTYQQSEDGTVESWDHFDIRVAPRHKSQNLSKVGAFNTHAATLKRALEEITIDSATTVRNLIADNELYRGEQYAAAVTEFITMHGLYHASDNKNVFVWDHAESRGATLRNSAIGTLLVDLSEGKDLNEAVRSYDRVVAPQNFKRSKSLITPTMIKNATEALDELGLRTAISRRFATASDVSVNDVIWANVKTKDVMRDSLEALLMSSTAVKRQAVIRKGAVISISAEEFYSTVLPGTENLELLFEPDMPSQLVSVIAPVDENAGSLFSWGNNFSWSYNGEVTDSIRDRVIKAGGGVEGALRVSLAWSCADDFDLHCFTPDRDYIYYGAKRDILDVDMNVLGENPKDPVENMIFGRLASGTYQFWVHNFNNHSRRPNTGFELEVASVDGVTHFHYAASLGYKDRSPGLSITVKNGKIVDISSTMASSRKQTTVWGIRTGEFIPVSMVMCSPNFWGGNKSGNKHHMFVLENCVNDARARGIYNEFLRSDLQKHRKVFEVLGSQTACEPSEDQLSGVGFSTTLNKEVTLRADGCPYNVRMV